MPDGSITHTSPRRVRPTDHASAGLRAYGRSAQNAYLLAVASQLSRASAQMTAVVPVLPLRGSLGISPSSLLPLQCVRSTDAT